MTRSFRSSKNDSTCGIQFPLHTQQISVSVSKTLSFELTRDALLVFAQRLWTRSSLREVIKKVFGGGTMEPKMRGHINMFVWRRLHFDVFQMDKKFVGFFFIGQNMCGCFVFDFWPG